MNEDFYLAVPLQKNQLSCREIMNGELLKNGLILDQPLLISDLQSEYAAALVKSKHLEDRGI